MEMVLPLKPICSQNILVHQPIQFRTPLDHVDEYGARCVGMLELSMLSSGRSSAVRRELATREHMLDHGQLGPATPVDSPVGSRRSSSSQTIPIPRHPSESAPCRPSRLSFSSKSNESLSMSSIEPTTVGSAHPIHTLRSMAHTSMDSTSALDIEDEIDSELISFPANPPSAELDLSKDNVSIDAHILGLPLSDAVVSVTDDNVQPEAKSKGAGDASLPIEHFIKPSELSLHLFANPTLAALRSTNSPVSPSSLNSPPILLNAKCSGYFVEPVSPQDHH